MTRIAGFELVAGLAVSLLKVLQGSFPLWYFTVTLDPYRVWVYWVFY